MSSIKIFFTQYLLQHILPSLRLELGVTVLMLGEVTLLLLLVSHFLHGNLLKLPKIVTCAGIFFLLEVLLLVVLSFLNLYSKAEDIVVGMTLPLLLAILLKTLSLVLRPFVAKILHRQPKQDMAAQFASSMTYNPVNPPSQQFTPLTVPVGQQPVYTPPPGMNAGPQMQPPSQPFSFAPPSQQFGQQPPSYTPPQGYTQG